MTRPHRVTLVIEREVRESLRRKALWITAGLALLGTTAILVLPDLLASDGASEVGVIGKPGQVFTRALQEAGSTTDAEIDLVDSPDAATARQAVRDGDLDAAVVLDDPTRLIVDQRSDPVVAVLRQALSTDHTVDELDAAGLGRPEITRALAPPRITVDVVEADRAGRVAAASVIAVAVYLLLFFVTMQVANGVAIEKSNRVSEVLLAIVAPRDMLFGKVAGVGLTALLPLLAGAIPVVVKLTVSNSLPPGTGSAVAAAAGWFVLGAGFYLLAAGALGALVERQEDAGSAVAVLSILLVGSYVIGISAADSPVGAVLAYLPFSAPMVEPARLAMGVSSPVEVLGSLIVCALSVLVMARVASVVYARAVVRTGSRLHLADVLRTPS